MHLVYTVLLFVYFLAASAGDGVRDMAAGQGARQSARAVRPPAGRGQSRPPAVGMGARGLRRRGARGAAAAAGAAGRVPRAPARPVHDHRDRTAGGPRLRARRRRRLLRAVRFPVVRESRPRPHRAGAVPGRRHRDLAQSAPGLPAARRGRADRQRPAVRTFVPALSSRPRRDAGGCWPTWGASAPRPRSGRSMFVAIGADPDRVTVTGSLKFDAAGGPAGSSPDPARTPTPTPATATACGPRSPSRTRGRCSSPRARCGGRRSRSCGRSRASGGRRRTRCW